MKCRPGKVMGRRVDTQRGLDLILRDALVWARDHADEWKDLPHHCDVACEDEVRCALTRLIVYLYDPATR